ncbi:NADP-dependent alkenal double bond reductase P1 [Hibiscus syriacus]|uniref:NADP-dependent alkenal double bond reductase P1 n=1 Tax=Hibiscus syriacus TaxID=106335 RepID=A0A6A3D492_HIBSY|nr:2-alkenal reductase (NADP(+)-dependent)-like [Hibiscus syriacus]KAE8734059.1 NADP-dependent alkenal double bond reductase P1 [Hibiscus syriacus]
MGTEGMDEASNMKVVLKHYVSGSAQETDMHLTAGTMKLKAPDDSNAVVVKNLFLSCDHYMIFKMTKHDRYADPYPLGSPITGYGVAKILDSAHPDFAIDELVWGITGWEEYSLISDTTNLIKIEHPDVPLSYYTGILGMPGMTAYVGFYELCAAKKGDHVFISAACGGVGQLLGQFAKLHGCHVVGSAASPEKVDLLKNKYGFDEAFNFKDEPDYNATLKRYFPEGIDIYFDNVGGKMLDAVLLNLRANACVVMCGMITHYHLEQPEGIHNLPLMVNKEARIQGYLAVDYYHLYPKYLETILPLIKASKVVYVEDVADGLENAAKALVRMLSGRNVGKQVVAVNFL